MAKFWLDCEFQEDGRTIDLISIGMVREDGAELYAENDLYDRRFATPWLRQNVIPLLNGYGARPEDIAAELIRFCGDSPEIWGWYGAYDWVCLCQIFGTMMDLPRGWPFYIREAVQCMPVGFILPERATPEHHALWDARWQRDVWYALGIEAV